MEKVYICHFKQGNYTSVPMCIFTNEAAAQRYCQRCNETAKKEGVSIHYYYYENPIWDKPYWEE